MIFNWFCHRLGCLWHTIFLNDFQMYSVSDLAADGTQYFLKIFSNDSVTDLAAEGMHYFQMIFKWLCHRLVADGTKYFQIIYKLHCINDTKPSVYYLNSASSDMDRLTWKKRKLEISSTKHMHAIHFITIIYNKGHNSWGSICKLMPWNNFVDYCIDITVTSPGALLIGKTEAENNKETDGLPTSKPHWKFFCGCKSIWVCVICHLAVLMVNYGTSNTTVLEIP